MNRRHTALAGHRGDESAARAALDHADPAVRATAIGALERMGRLGPDDLRRAARDAAPAVRRRAAEAAAHLSGTPVEDLLGDLLDDGDWSVAEMACWAVGEHEAAAPATLARIVELAGHHGEALVREAAVAALGAIGDPTGLPAILAATGDKPAVRRRAAVALAPFDGDEVEEALRRLRSDRDWQTRQIAEDLLDER